MLGGGARLKNAYEEAKANSDAKEEEFTKSFEHKRFLTKERNQMKQQKEEAEQYNTILEQFKASKINLTLFQLFHLHNDIEKKKGEAKQQQKVTTRMHKEGRTEAQWLVRLRCSLPHSRPFFLFVARCVAFCRSSLRATILSTSCTPL